MDEAQFVPHEDRFVPNAPPERAARDFYEVLRRRRSVRHFSRRPVSREAIEWLVRCAQSAPSGANKQPWRFVCVQDPGIKGEIRAAAEKEELEFYAGRANQAWLRDLAPLGTDDKKEFLTDAPWIVAVFQLTKCDDGGQVYYPKESVGIACGLFLAAAQMAGLATLTHTPNPMRFLNRILGRPRQERPFLIIPVGYATDACRVPKKAIERRPLADVMVVL